MKIQKLIRDVSTLVAERKIIDHGSIRCLHSDIVAQEIESAEDCEEVGTAEIGDDDLAFDLEDLAGDANLIAELYLEDLVRLEDAYRGEDIEDYLDSDKEDELWKLDLLIGAARELIS